MAEETGEDRTEATPRRLQKAREQGDVAVSRELPALAVLAGAALVLAIAAPDLARRAAGRLAPFLSGLHVSSLSARDDHAPSAPLAAALGSAIEIAVLMTAPFAIAALVLAAGSVLLQTGFLISADGLKPKLGRLDPLAGSRRLLGPEALVEGLKSVLKVGLLAAVIWRATEDAIPGLAAAPFWDAAILLDRTARQVLHLVLAVVAAQAAIAVLDVLWVRVRHGRRLRMSREDVRQEHKEAEGDPQIRQRLRQVRQQRMRRRMLAAVPKATVVVTNPIHYAVALAYERGARSAAPRVVAKGADLMAARIRDAARAAGVPLVSNPPLARALFQVELDHDIPAEHYQAVAEVIAYVWRLRGRVAGRTEPA